MVLIIKFPIKMNLISIQSSAAPWMRSFNGDTNKFFECLQSSFSAKRKITAFITYSFDSKEHMKNVISLAKNLQRNGFGVAIDEKDKDLVPESEKKEVNKLRYQKVGILVLDVLYIRSC